MADWAYGVSLLDLSEYCISNALDADVSDKILRADCLSMASAIARLRGNLAAAIKAYDECVKVCTDTRNIYIITSPEGFMAVTQDSGSGKGSSAS